MTANTEHTNDFRRGSRLLMVALATAIWIFLSLSGFVPHAEAILIGWTIGFLVGYWIPPRPYVGFAPWTAERLALISCFYLAVFKIPLLLERFMSILFAYGIPVVVFIAAYFVWTRHPKSSLKFGRV